MRTKTKFAALAMLLGTALAIPAIAQTTTLSQYPACPDPPPKLSQADLDAAHVVFLSGEVAKKEGDYGKAVDAYKDAYRRDCSKPVLLRFIALAYEAKGDKAEALNAFETYLKRDPKAEDVETTRKHIENLKAQIAAQPTATATTTTTATGTATAPTATTTATTPPPERGHTAGPWVLVGVGGAAIIPGVILTIVGQSDISDSRSGCTTSGTGLSCPSYKGLSTVAPAGGTSPSDAERGRVQNQGLLFRGFGIGLLAGGVAIVAAGLVWHFLEPTGPVKADAKLRVLPEWKPGYGGLLFTGSF